MSDTHGLLLDITNLGKEEHWRQVTISFGSFIMHMKSENLKVYKGYYLTRISMSRNSIDK